MIGGDAAGWHVRFDQAGSLETFELRRRVKADSRFGACIDRCGRNVFVAGGLAQLGWYVLGGENFEKLLASGKHQHEAPRGYQFTCLQDCGAAHALCSDDYFVR
eukprot:COSAG05_NODE_6743_length_910_cov_1.050555_2_plen_104_part_00